MQLVLSHFCELLNFETHSLITLAQLSVVIQAHKYRN